MSNTTVQFHEVLAFWFEELTRKQWFEKNDNLDKVIKRRFESTLVAAAQCELFNWRSSAEGRLAEIIVLDQFSRNIYRNQPGAFAQDALALALAQETISLGFDQRLSDDQRGFLYMPFMHSESVIIHQEALKLFSQPGMEGKYSYELRHKEIIDRFGRYPHRNEILNRESTAEELAFLHQPGSRF